MQRCRKRLPGSGHALDSNETSVMQVQAADHVEAANEEESDIRTSSVNLLFLIQ